MYTNKYSHLRITCLTNYMQVWWMNCLGQQIMCVILCDHNEVNTVWNVTLKKSVFKSGYGNEMAQVVNFLSYDKNSDPHVGSTQTHLLSQIRSGINFVIIIFCNKSAQGLVQIKCNVLHSRGKCSFWDRTRLNCDGIHNSPSWCVFIFKGDMEWFFNLLQSLNMHSSIYIKTSHTFISLYFSLLNSSVRGWFVFRFVHTKQSCRASLGLQTVIFHTDNYW